MGEQQRLFFALWPSETQQRQWSSLHEQYLAKGAGRPVPPENLHITLLFIGSVAESTRQCLQQMADGLKVPPFILRFNQMGYWRRPQVVWWGTNDMPIPLLDLAEGLKKGAQRCGLVADPRPFQAHMTLARKVKRAPAPVQTPVIDWPVNDFALIQSQLTQQGARYEVLASWPLTNP